MKGFGAWLAGQRKIRGITQEELAEALGVSARTVTRMEIGEGLPNRNNLRRLANYFGQDFESVNAIATGHAVPQSPHRPASIQIDDESMHRLESLASGAGVSAGVMVERIIAMADRPLGDLLMCAARDMAHDSRRDTSAVIRGGAVSFVTSRGK